MLILKSVATWLDLPISSCNEEILELAKRKGGYGIPLMKTLALQLRLSLRFSLKNSKDDDLVTIWNQTTQKKNAKIDSLIDQQKTKQSAMNLLASEHSLKIDNHISSLKLQGKSFIEIQKALPQKSISNWNSFLESVPDHLHICEKGHAATTTDSCKPVSVEQNSIIILRSLRSSSDK